MTHISLHDPHNVDMYMLLPCLCVWVYANNYDSVSPGCGEFELMVWVSGVHAHFFDALRGQRQTSG